VRSTALTGCSVASSKAARLTLLSSRDTREDKLAVPTILLTCVTVKAMSVMLAGIMRKQQGG
jgi:hypothetical protein